MKDLKARGASYRQLERLTGIGRGLIQNCDGTDLSPLWHLEIELNEGLMLLK